MATTRRNTRALPELITNATLGELIASALEELSDPAAPVRSEDGHMPPAPSRTERAQRAMYARAAAQIRAFHAPDDGEGAS